MDVSHGFQACHPPLLHRDPFNLRRKLMSASSSTSPLTLPKHFVHSPHQTAPPTPSPSPSPPVPLCVRLSNGNHSVPSPTSSFNGVSFLLQIGLTREMVTLEPHDLTLSSVKDLVCSIVDQKVMKGFSQHLNVSLLEVRFWLRGCS